MEREWGRCEIVGMAKKVTPRLKTDRPTYFFKAWRKYRRLTQQQLADRIDSAVSTISQLENGQQGFTDSTLMALADALMCEPGDLLSRDPNVEGTVVDLLRLIREKDAAASVMAFLNALPSRTGTDN